MKFSYKILLCTIMTMAVAFGISGYLFINYVFENSMEREIGQALNESSILQFAFETAALNIPSKYGVLQNGTIEQIGIKLENSGGYGERLLRLSDEDRMPLYASGGFVAETDFLGQIEARTRVYRVIRQEGQYYIQTGAVINSLDRFLYLETMKDVTQVYEERTKGFSTYRRMMLAVLFVSSVVMLFIAHFLTRPVRILTRATRKMAQGDYSYRAKLVSRDEMGQLTIAFNNMANALEENIKKLEEAIQSREEFIAAFSHELKTPLTAIIGYADLLRSHKLDEEKAFLSANYIYTEGKRLETMAFRLLDMTVTRRGEVDLQPFEVEQLFTYIKNLHEANDENGMEFVFDYEPGVVHGEADLLKTVLNNLVDKSRSRSRNGAGLGLALCAEILKLHGSELEIESTLGEGSCIGFRLKAEPGEEAAEDENA